MSNPNMMLMSIANGKYITYSVCKFSCMCNAQIFSVDDKVRYPAEEEVGEKHHHKRQRSEQTILKVKHFNLHVLNTFI